MLDQLLAKLFAIFSPGPPSFNTWDEGFEQLKTLSVKTNTAHITTVLSRMWDISLDQNLYKPGWIMAVDDDGQVDSLSCFRHGQGQSDNLSVTGGGFVLLIRIDDTDIKKYGTSSASERHFVQYLKELCRSQLR